MVVRMRHTKGQRNQRRSHDALKGLSLAACPKCGTMTLRHRACVNCGFYRGREVVKMGEVLARKEERRKAKARAMGEAVKSAEGAKEEK